MILKIGKLKKNIGIDLEMKIAILYICTGRYNKFFKGFYESARKYLLHDDAELTFFVFTDDMNLIHADDVKLIRKECAGFPADSLFRFKMFLDIKNELRGYDYIYFFNSNAEFKASVGREILPSSPDEIVAAEWPCRRKPFHHPMFFPYEHRRRSRAYISPYSKSPFVYYMGGVNGGTSETYLQMIETLAKNIDEDYANGIVAYVHDESHINHYLRSHKCKSLSSAYCMPEEWVRGRDGMKMIFRDKVKVDPYFDKGRDRSIKGILKKGCHMIWRAVSWYF